MTKHNLKTEFGGLGWRPDTPDARDYKLLLAPAPRPDHVDLRPMMPHVYDQGQLGSCTGNAIAAAMEYARIKGGLVSFTPSRLMIYYEERKLENTIMVDAGAEIRDGMKAMNKVGACDERFWPYKVAKFWMKPPAKCYKLALDDQLVSYSRVTQSTSQLEAAVANGFPVVFGFAVYESFVSDAVAGTGTVPMPSLGESMLGGHAVLIVGYMRAQKRFIVRNSWGASWGDAGYFTLPYAYVTDNNLADDFWTVKTVG